MAEPSKSPEELEKRIKAYKKKMEPKAGFAQALGLVFSLGFTVVFVIYGCYWLGKEANTYLNLPWILPFSLFAGVIGGFWIGYILIKPLLKTPINSNIETKNKE